MRLVIADDEPLARERLKRLLSETPEHAVVAEAASGAELLAAVKHSQPDAVLLDIHMPGLDGLQAARALAALPLPPALIFVTAYEEHALAAFDTLASGFLLKPVRAAQLKQALDKAQRSTRAQRPAAAQRYVSGLVRGDRVRVPAQEVLYFVAEDKYTRVIYLRGELLIEDSLRTLEDALDSDFIRIHRQYLAARERVEALETSGDQPVVRLRGAATTLPVSRRCLPAVRKLLSGRD
ncbi:MAG: LytR/AlgR family response regulator transcription factor [Nevskiales bacterium]